jgi:hypothetical protein
MNRENVMREAGIRCVAASLILAFALGGCSANVAGAAGSFPVVTGSGGGSSSSTRTTLSIRIPKRVRSHRGRHERYVSPSTVSASIVIDPASGCTACSPQVSNVVGLTPDSPNCASGAAGTTCTFSLVLAPGSYTGTIATYDGPPGCTTSCHALSVNQSFPLIIVAGKANTPALTLYGVPAGVMLVPITSNGSVQVSDFFVGGVSEKATAFLYAVDHDGSFIVGPGTPSLSLASQPTGGWAASISGNVLHVTSPSTLAQQGSALGINVASPACQLPGTQCTYYVDLLSSAMVAVADPVANDVRIYRSHTQTPQTYAYVTNGIDDPVDIAFDPGGDLYVANQGNGNVTKYAPPYTGAPVATIATGLSTLTKIAYSDQCGNVAVVDGGSRSVAIYLGPTFAAAPTVFGYASIPTALSFDYNCTLWVAKPGSVIGYANGYSSPPSPVLSIGNPSAVRYVYPGNLFVADSAAGSITEYSSPGYATGASITGLNTPSTLASSFEQLFACSIGQATQYTTSPFAFFATTETVSGMARPCLLSTDNYGGVWTYDPVGYIDTTAQIFGLNVSSTVSAMAVFPPANSL